jgi:sugar lactone lactonase YvrE
MYIIGSTNDTVYQYTLSTAWDVSTASYASKSFSVASQEIIPAGFTFNSNGSRMYVIGSTNDKAYQYSLATLWDVSTASYDGVGLLVADSSPTALALRDDDSRLYAIGSGSDAVEQFELPNPGSLQTPGYVDAQSFSVASQEGGPSGLAFKPDGTTMYVVGTANDTVYQYTLSTAWDVSTASYASKSFSVASQETAPQGVVFKPDGTAMYIIGNTSDTVYQYTLSTAWDVSTASYASKSFSVASQESSPQDVAFKPDGTRMYVIGTTGDDINEYSLSTAWDVSTASYVQIFSIAPQDGSPTGIYFRADGVQMYVVGTGNEMVYQYILSTPWDVSTAQYQDLAFDVRSQAGNPQGVVFREADGTSMYVLDLTSLRVHQYYLR